MFGSSINMAVIMHECNYSKKKSAHLFSMEHNCKKSKCSHSEKKSSEERVTKTPCCKIETTFVKNQDFSSSQREFTQTHAIILHSLFSVLIPKSESLNNTTLPLEPEPKLFGFQYRIAMQSFLC